MNSFRFGRWLTSRMSQRDHPASPPISFICSCLLSWSCACAAPPGPGKGCIVLKHWVKEEELASLYVLVFFFHFPSSPLFTSKNWLRIPRVSSCPPNFVRGRASVDRKRLEGLLAPLAAGFSYFPDYQSLCFPDYQSLCLAQIKGGVVWDTMGAVGFREETCDPPAPRYCHCCHSSGDKVAQQLPLGELQAFDL